MMIVDAQVHIWAANTPDRPWAGHAKPHRMEPYSKDDLLREMDDAGVDRAVLIPPSVEGDRNDLALAAAHQHPDRFAVMGTLMTAAPDARTRLANWRATPGMLGLRFSFNKQDCPHWLWADAETHQVPVMLSV